MSMTLILWKGPVLSDPDEAKALVDAWVDTGDDSAFEPSEDIALMADALRCIHPDAGPDAGPAAPDDAGPWADTPFEQTDRLLALSIRWSADVDIFPQISALARLYGLILYDPQGPEIHLPRYPMEAGEASKPGFAGYAKTLLMLAGAVGLFLLGWWLPVPVLNWLLMAAGGFLAIVLLFLLAALILAPGELRR